MKLDALSRIIKHATKEVLIHLMLDDEDRRFDEQLARLEGIGAAFLEPLAKLEDITTEQIHAAFVVNCPQLVQAFDNALATCPTDRLLEMQDAIDESRLVAEALADAVFDRLPQTYGPLIHLDDVSRILVCASYDAMRAPYSDREAERRLAQMKLMHADWMLALRKIAGGSEKFTREQLKEAFTPSTPNMTAAFIQARQKAKDDANELARVQKIHDDIVGFTTRTGEKFFEEVGTC